MKLLISALLGALLLFCNLAMSQTTAATQSTAAGNDSVVGLRQAGRRIFRPVLHLPSLGRHAAGFHQYDLMLEDYSQKSRDAEIAFLNDQKQKFAGFPADHLNEDQRADLKLVSNAIDARLLELQEIRSWQRNPDNYSSSPTYSIFILMSRNFAPPDERLKSVIAREQKMPANFAAAKANLKDVPKIYTEIALEQMPGIISFFQNDVPAAFKSVTDPKLLAEFKASNDKVIFELQRYQDFLKNDLLPISNGDFRIGAENYRKKLLYEEMVDIPLDRLLQIGYDDLHKNQAELKRVAAQIDPNKTPEQILEELEQDHPPPDQLLQSFRDTFNGLVEFIQQKQIVTIPSQVRPIVEETPPFVRALSSASMDTPGPYENKATEAYLQRDAAGADLVGAARPRSGWKASIAAPSSAPRFTRPIPDTTRSSCGCKQAPSKVRKLIGCGSNAEGWAHYCEQMMLDEGYGNGDLKLRLGQLQDALLRDARYIVGIQMHTGKMTLEQATEFFVKEGHQTPAVAEREAKRGTSDPTYLVYTLGKLEIMKLRADYKQKMGDKFNLEQFHDEFMKQGYPPIKIIREKMLGNDSPVL